MKRILDTLRSALLAVLVIAAGGHEAAFAARKPAAPPSAPAALDQCSWDRPGADPFMGDVVAAVDHYGDIAPDVRKRIQARMVKRAYDDVVVIKQASIVGKGRYGSTIRDMHFGANRMCRTVSRARWSEAVQERGLVYCDSGQCILVPTVCRNVSRITRAEVADEHVAAAPADFPVDLPAQLPATLDAVPPILPPALPDGAMPLAEGDTGGAHTFASAAGIGSGFGAAGGIGGAAPGAPGAQGSIATASLVPPPVTPVPEPETWLMMLSGLLATAGCAKRRGRRG